MMLEPPEWRHPAASPDMADLRRNRMSIMDRLSRLIRANVNDLVSKAEDPTKIIEQALEDMRQAYQQARVEVAQSMAQLEKLDRERREQEASAADYQAKAEEALRLSRDDLAREALQRKKSAQAVSDGIAVQLDKQRQIVEDLKTQLRALEGKIDELETRKKLLDARASTVAATESLQHATGVDKANSAMSAFEKMEEKVASREDVSKAQASLGAEDDLDSQLAKLGKDKEVDDELEALKRKVNTQS